jgi:hypothetical protein
MQLHYWMDEHPEHEHMAKLDPAFEAAAGALLLKVRCAAPRGVPFSRAQHLARVSRGTRAARAGLPGDGAQ